MKKVLYFCDRCGKELDNFFRIQVGKHNGSGVLSDMVGNEPELCPSCYEIVEQAIVSAMMAEKPEPKKPAAPKRQARNTVDLDMPKVHALRNAGWSYEKIGVEFGVSPQTIWNKLAAEEAAKEAGDE